MWTLYIWYFLKVKTKGLYVNKQHDQMIMIIMSQNLQLFWYLHEKYLTVLMYVKITI